MIISAILIGAGLISENTVLECIGLIYLILTIISTWMYVLKGLEG